jgi:hypothetical protein
VQTSPAQVHGAKVVNYFELSKKKCFLGCFFWCGVYGVECKGRDLLGGVPPSTKQGGQEMPQYDWELINKETIIPECHSGE